MTTVVFRPAAAADAEDGYLWYEIQKTGLGEEFLSEVSDALNRIIENPESYPVIHRDTHRALLRRFPYGLFYRVQGDRIVVVALMHAKRDPRRWVVRR